MNIKQSFVLVLVAIILLVILIIGVNSETQKYAFCECSGCSGCEYKLFNTSCQVVKLNKNVTNQSVICIHQIPSGKTFDCQGHEISAEKEKNVSYGIKVSGNNVTLKNCKIKNFKQGIYFALAMNSLLDNNKLIDNQENGVVFVMSRNNTISNNFAKNNVIGFYIASNSFYNIFEHNSATENEVGYVFSSTWWQYNEVNNNFGCDNRGVDIACAWEKGANNTFGIVLNCPYVNYSSCSSLYEKPMSKK